MVVILDNVVGTSPRPQPGARLLSVVVRVKRLVFHVEGAGPQRIDGEVNGDGPATHAGAVAEEKRQVRAAARDVGGRVAVVGAIQGRVRGEITGFVFDLAHLNKGWGQTRVRWASIHPASVRKLRPA